MKSRSSKKKGQKDQKSLDEFYGEDQKKQILHEEAHKRHRNDVEKIEQDIFEHLKQHTKKILNAKK